MLIGVRWGGGRIILAVILVFFFFFFFFFLIYLTVDHYSRPNNKIFLHIYLTAASAHICIKMK